MHPDEKPDSLRKTMSQAPKRQESASQRESQQMMIERQDTANEEPCSANAETISSKELETSKEELQATNALYAALELLDGRQLLAIIEMSQDAVIVRDANNEVTSWNRGAESMYGWTAEEARGKPLDLLLGTNPGVWTELNARLDTQGTWEGELHQERRDGTPVVVRCREILLRDAHGSRSAVLAILRDVTERQKALDALTEADRRKDELLAKLAHELRKPLAPILDAVEILSLAGDVSEQVGRVREILSRQARHLNRIVDDLLDVTRIAREKLELRGEKVALNSVVAAAVEPEGGRSAEPQATSSKAPGSAPKRILVVDDNPDQVKSLGCLLGLMGHDVRLAESAAAALETASEFNPEVALVDLGMPGMDGYELARRLRRDPRLRGILLVAQTGWGQREDFRRSSEAGFDHHLVKPITAAALQKVLEEDAAAKPKRGGPASTRGPAAGPSDGLNGPSRPERPPRRSN